jgi:two-component sensor histidine kinase
MLTDPQGLAREEAHHRFLNTLTALHLLLRRDFGAFDDPGVRDAVATFEARLLTFAGIEHSLATPAAGLLDVPVHFGRLCAQLAAVLLAPRSIACEFFADEGEMEVETGEKLGLILAELVTNAAKHAFSGRSHGRVTVTLRRAHRGWKCVVQDDGAGLRQGQLGSGLRLVGSLAHGIQGHLTTASDAGGTRIELRFPDPPSRADALGPGKPAPGGTPEDLNGARLRSL